MSSSLNFVTTGSDGHTGANGQHGGNGYGGNGSPGQNGTRGQDATPIDITLQADSQDPSSASSATVSGSHSGTIAVGADSNHIHLESHGGRGGDGGKGGDGGRGSRGQDGRDASKHSSATNGSDGGPGGNGGKGGSGGDGGDGAFCNVHVAEADMDLLMLCNRCDVSGGGVGIGGSGGSGGPGGAGGRGGSSWHGGENDHPSHRSGGSSGRTGRSGHSGSSGASGHRGKDAQFAELVNFAGTERSFPWRYVATHEQVILKDLITNDGIFEPGERCSVQYHVRNTGPMPMPSKQNVNCGVFENNIIVNTSTSDLKKLALASNDIETQQDPIEWQVKPIPEPPVDSKYCTATDMKWKIKIDRVNKLFSQGEVGYPTTIPIQYPVNVSPVKGEIVIAAQEEAALCLKLSNISQIAIGSEAGRNLRVRVTIVSETEGMTPLDNPNVCRLLTVGGEELPTGVDVPVSSLASNDNQLITTMFKFGPDAKQYSAFTVGVELFLGALEDFRDERRIQRMKHDVQLAAYYSPNAVSEVLVVNNSTASRESYLAWNERFGQMGFGQVSFWNSSLYGGLSLLRNIGNNRPVIEDYRSKTIVIINNEAKANDEGIVYTMETLPSREIAKSLREYNLGICIIGKKINWRYKLMPSDIRDFTPICEVLGTKEKDSTRRRGEATMPRNRNGFIAALSDHIIPIETVDSVADIVDRMGRSLSENVRAKVFAQAICVAAGEEIFNLSEEAHKDDEPPRPAAGYDGTGHQPFDSAMLRISSPELRKKRLEDYFQLHFPFLANPNQLDEVLARYTDDEAIYKKLLPPIFGGFEAPMDPDDVVRVEMPKKELQELAVNHQKFAMHSDFFPAFERDITKRLNDAALDLYAKIAKRRPQWRFVIAYELAPYFQRWRDGNEKLLQMPCCVGEVQLTPCDPLSSSIGIFPQDPKMYIGRLLLLRTGNRNGPNVVHCPHDSQSSIRKTDIMSYHYAAALVRTTPFVKKLQMIGVGHHDPSARLFAGRAIAADIAVEQKALRRFEWNEEISGEELLNHLPNLCAWVAACFQYLNDPTAEPLISEVNAILVTLIQRWKRWYDNVMASRRWRDLTNVSLNVITAVTDRCPSFPDCLKRVQEDTKELSLEALIQKTIFGNLLGAQSTHMPQIFVDELQYRTIDADHLDCLNDRDADMHLIAGRNEVRTSRDRALMLQNLKTEFIKGKDSITRGTTDFLFPYGPPQGINVEGTVRCNICWEEFGGPASYCKQSNWYVCTLCSRAAMDAAWNTTIAAGLETGGGDLTLEAPELEASEAWYLSHGTEADHYRFRRERLHRFFSHYHPAELKNIDTILATWRHPDVRVAYQNFEELMDRLRKQWGPEPPKNTPSADEKSTVWKKRGIDQLIHEEDLNGDEDKQRVYTNLEKFACCGMHCGWNWLHFFGIPLISILVLVMGILILHQANALAGEWSNSSRSAADEIVTLAEGLMVPGGIILAYGISSLLSAFLSGRINYPWADWTADAVSRAVQRTGFHPTGCWKISLQIWTLLDLALGIAAAIMGILQVFLKVNNSTEVKDFIPSIIPVAGLLGAIGAIFGILMQCWSCYSLTWDSYMEEFHFYRCPVCSLRDRSVLEPRGSRQCAACYSGGGSFFVSDSGDRRSYM